MAMPTNASVRALGEFAASRHGTFNSSQAADHGVSRHDIARLMRDGAIDRVRQGVYRYVDVAVTPVQMLYASTLGVRAVGSYFSAAALHGIEGFTCHPRRPEILCHHAFPVRMPGAIVRHTSSMPRADVVPVDGVPSTTLARTACDLARYITHDQLVRVVDDIQRRGASMQWLIDRASRLQAIGRRGPTAVREIAERRLHGYVVPESQMERLLSTCLRSPILEGIVRQHELRTPSDEFVARFDLAVPWVRLGIEGHSRSFHLGEAAERYDEDRDIRVAQQGWEIAYLGFAATRAPVAVCHDIEMVVRRRAADFGLVPPTARAARALR
ncbi:MAG: hypothetical protein JWN39_281 [Ilumatobacteraceae bacterium]|nr:hypothetical protein [Ilumatobacteraceae bacterium]